MPTTNPFFSQTTGYTGEQQLIDSLVTEQIGIYGLDLMYMPRENVNLDRLLHEATKDVFSLAMSIPMYIKSYDGYDQSMEVLSKFGVRSSDELTLIMSRSQWTTYYAPYVKSFYNAQSGRPELAENNQLEGQTSRRPKEGDLIFFPFDGGIFEVKYVMFDQPFFQLGKGYIFELQCEKFEYSGEDFKTGVTAIDEIVVRNDFPTAQFTMVEYGISNFQFQERVRIFNLTDLDYTELTTEGGNFILNEALQFIQPDKTDIFQLYNDAGLVTRVPYVEADVADWDGVNRILKVQNLTDLDPNQINPETGDVTMNDFDTVLIIGATTGASWVSTRFSQMPKPFDDADVLQEEFNRIKVYDPADAAPFGFF